MMLARVADSLYWIGRYVERAEHMCRLSDVMLNATLDRSEAATQVARIALAAVGDPDAAKEAWQRFYFTGEVPEALGTAPATHANKRRLKTPRVG